jgi:hypothetical protein
VARRGLRVDPGFERRNLARQLRALIARRVEWPPAAARFQVHRQQADLGGGPGWSTSSTPRPHASPQREFLHVGATAERQALAYREAEVLHGPRTGEAEAVVGEHMGRDVLGWRRLFGVMGPSTNTVVQPDFDMMRPAGVTNHYSPHLHAERRCRLERDLPRRRGTDRRQHARRRAQRHDLQSRTTS